VKQESGFSVLHAWLGRPVRDGFPVEVPCSIRIFELAQPLRRYLALSIHSDSTMRFESKLTGSTCNSLITYRYLVSLLSIRLSLAVVSVPT